MQVQRKAIKMNDQNETNEQLEVAPVAEVGQMELLSEKQMQSLAERVEQQQKIRQIVLKVTKAHHWRPMGESAYLEQMGCKVIASFLGLGMDVDEPVEQREDDDAGTYYSFTTKVTITFRGRSVDEFGYADSRDDFFTHGGKLPQSEVKKGNIKKKSITNAMNRGIKAILGLDFTRAEVEAAVGSLGGQTGVDYKSKPKEELTANDIELKADMKKKIWLMVEKDEIAAKAYIKNLTAFKDFKGHEDFDKVSMKQWNFKKTQINEEYAQWEKAQ